MSPGSGSCFWRLEQFFNESGGWMRWILCQNFSIALLIWVKPFINIINYVSLWDVIYEKVDIFKVDIFNEKNFGGNFHYFYEKTEIIRD